MELTLINGKVGTKYILESISDPIIAIHLHTMGIREGSQLEILHKTWNHKAITIETDGIKLALRKKEAATLTVQISPE